MAAPDTSAPNYALEVNNTPVAKGVKQLIKKVEFESTDGMADVMKLTCINPENQLTNAKIFQPGNEIFLWMGYGSDLRPIGRAIIAKHRPDFPTDGMPMLQVVGYTKDHKMMDNAPEKAKAAKGKHGRLYKDEKYSEAVKTIAASGFYKMDADVDDTPEASQNFIQKVGLKDYDFVQGLANLTGFIFWVDGDATGKWTLHFKNPETLKEGDKEYKFEYNFGDLTSILSFQPEMLIRDLETKIKVQCKNTKTGKLVEFDIEEDNNQSPDVEASGDPTGEIKGAYTTASDIKIYIGDFSFEMIGNRKFRDASEVQNWARQWFRRNREQFIIGSGRLIGVEDLMARQIHDLSGLGQGYDGKYYFTKVRHIQSEEDGYVCEFSARKVVPAVA